MRDLVKYWIVGMMWIVGVAAILAALYLGIAFLAQSTLGLVVMVIIILSGLAIKIGMASMHFRNLDYPIRTAEDDLADSEEEHF